MKKNTILGMVVLAIVGLVMGTVFVTAYRGDATQVGPNYDEERHVSMEEAFVNSDYESWYALMTQNGMSPGVLRWVNKDNFETFVNMREAMISGDIEKSEELRDEIGMGQGKRGSSNSQKGNTRQGGCPMKNGGGSQGSFGCQTKATSGCPYSN